MVKILSSLALSSLLTSNAFGMSVLGDEGCTYVIGDIQYEKGYKGPDQFDSCILPNGLFVQIEGLSNEFKTSKEGETLVSGKSIIRIPGASIENGVLTIPPKAQVSVESISTGANMNTASTGTKKVLVIRSTGQSTTTSSVNVISDSVFGTFGDPVNLKSQYAACSYNSLIFEPYSASQVSNGVGEVSLTTSVNGMTNYDAQSLILSAANSKYGDLGSKVINGVLDHVMLCVPPGTQDGWIAYAYVNSWLSVYNDDWCTYVSGQMHEIGHNLGLAHSGETSTYDDQSGMMGYSYYGSDSPRMCFNAAKNWQLGWYPNGQYSIAPMSTDSKPKTFSGKLLGLASYQSLGANDKAMIQITGYSEDYYVSFNRATGINSETYEGADQVMVHSRAPGIDYQVSYLRSKLNSGGTYEIGSGAYKTVITVNTINLGSPGYATVTIVGPNTNAPVSSPTNAPTNAPINPPTSPSTPTSFPTHRAPTMFPTNAAPVATPVAAPNSGTCKAKGASCTKNTDCCKRRCKRKKCLL